MPSSKSPERAAQDILYHIDLAAHFVEGFGYAAFSNDLRTTYAVTRCLEVISARHPAIPWKRVAGSGSIYRHDYEDVAARYVSETTQRDLPILREGILAELARLGGE